MFMKDEHASHSVLSGFSVSPSWEIKELHLPLSITFLIWTCASNAFCLFSDLLVCLLGYIVAFNYNTVDFANTGETPVVCIWLAIINCLTGLASIGTLTVMGIMSYQGIVRNEVAHENRMSRKVEAGVILGKCSALSSWNFVL